MESVKDKVVLITGASVGLGRGIAILFAKYGSRLALTGRNEANLEETAQKCAEQGLSKDKIMTVTADLTKESDVKNIVDVTLKKFGIIDVLVNNAAILNICNANTINVDFLDEIYKVNLRAIIQLTNICLPHLKEAHGNIVNISSVCGINPSPFFLAYGTMKAALDMYTKAIAIDLAPEHVRVNSVNPGWAYSEIHSRAGVTDDELQRYYDNTAAFHPIARTATSEEVANAVIFLASDAAQFITGTILPVDGGVTKTSAWYRNKPLEY